MRSLLASTLVLAGSAIAAPAPAPQTCTSDSVAVSEWSVSDFEYHASYVFTTPAHQNSAGTVNFSLTNAAVPYTAQCFAASTQLQDFFYGNVPYKCTLPAANSADEVTFTFNRASGELKLEHSWNCASENSRFKASGGANVGLKCHEQETKNDKWQMGQEYSRREISCDRVTLKVPITEKSGVA
ncbi:alternaria alternata allergen 1 domain-containing protein [Hirsutella rhossiliensis]|uniref:Alternaria alternata allergen 1 domain-containing protein n=1 Tax=Hirsutella rhossiliensis TaxID=111463 RepID=A0A9P8MRH9_9HYPO|nr:alternaria alternata allergen 1 domain-containing protein [Hirsutella rhossiliensis]KAH0959895.1 alternaria alternata allergen 1 domain-containing protein [Hirsutella rhossiliensis]